MSDDETSVADRLDKIKDGPRSVSQYNQWQKCPHQFYLQRVEKVWARPAAWLPQGLAVHESAEFYEGTGRTASYVETKEVYRDSYVKHTNRLCKETPNFDYWFASGPYKGEQDVARRFKLGLEQVDRYIDYYSLFPEEKIWRDDNGDPAVELGFDFDLDGVRVRGFIDQVIDHPTYGKIVRDIKSGNQPGDEFQLGVYAVAVNQEYGTEITKGDYWMGRKGMPTMMRDLKDLDRDFISESFKTMDEGVKSEEFTAKPEKSKCNFCPVNSSCVFVNH